jgi:hypothetical protein
MGAHDEKQAAAFARRPHEHEEAMPLAGAAGRFRFLFVPGDVRNDGLNGRKMPRCYNSLKYKPFLKGSAA